jgi:hypothetical protein
MRLGAGRVIVLVVVVVVVEALRQGLGTECVLCGDRTVEAAQHQLDVLLNLTRCRVGVHRRLRGMASMEGEVVVKRLAADRREVDPNFGLVDRVDRIGEINLIHTSVDAVMLRGNLEGNSRVLGCAIAPSLFISTPRVYRHIVSPCRADTRHRPNVDWVRALVGDDGFGVGESHNGAEDENAAGHAGDGARRGWCGRQ